MVVTFFQWGVMAYTMAMCKGDMDNFPTTNPPGERRAGFDLDSEIEMSIGTKLLMGVYITVAVLLSAVPFAIYMYILCKKTRINQRLKKLINKARGLPYDDNQQTQVIRWPYAPRDTEVESGHVNNIIMKDLPTYEEVMKNEHLYVARQSVFTVGNLSHSRQVCLSDERNDNISQSNQDTTLPQEGFLERSHGGESRSLPDYSNELENGMTASESVHFRTSGTQTGNVNTVFDAAGYSLSVTRL